MQVSSIDVYLTYTCNLRCSHCFVGNSLSAGHHFPYAALTQLIGSCRQWNTVDITFLGGEPTLYPQIVDAVKAVHASGARARMVTNGLHGFQKFMREFDGPELPDVGFSIDGSGPEVHDAIRGNRAFARMIPNIERARHLGYHTFGIVSISRTNASDVRNTLVLCDRLGLSYVNVHHVSNRGFASEQTVLAIDEWQAVCDEITSCSADLSLDVRLEKTFVSSGQHKAFCAVRDQSNLMFLPDGRVFMCPMFIDVPDAHSFVWTAAGLIERQGRDTEQLLCAPVIATHCPAMPFVNEGLCAGARERGMQISCVLEKTRLRRGSVVADSARALP